MNVKHYLMLDGERKGPFTFSQMQGMWQSGSITCETLHHMDGYADWMPLEVIMADLEPPAPARSHYPPAMPQRASRPVVVAKSRGVYILLGLFVFGLFGAHNFYAGRYVPAVIQLCITFFTGWLVLPLILVAFWVLIECVTVTKDGKGFPLS